MSLLESGNIRRTSVGVGNAIDVAREAFDAYDRQVAAIVVQSTMLIQDSARLYEENVRLREQVTRLQADWESERDYADQMEAKEKSAVAENAKLRELCDDFYKCLDTALYLAKDAGYPVMPDQKLFDSLYPRMRELGLVADE